MRRKQTVISSRCTFHHNALSDIKHGKGRELYSKPQLPDWILQKVDQTRNNAGLDHIVNRRATLPRQDPTTYLRRLKLSLRVIAVNSSHNIPNVLSTLGNTSTPKIQLSSYITRYLACYFEEYHTVDNNISFQTMHMRSPNNYCSIQKQGVARITGKRW